MSRPAFFSRARNSSNRKAFSAVLRAGSPRPSARNSSRRVNRHDGSSPITGTPAVDERRQRLEQPLGLVSRLADLAGRQIGAAAAQRARAERRARRRRRDDRPPPARAARHAGSPARSCSRRCRRRSRPSHRRHRRRSSPGRCRRATSAASASWRSRANGCTSPARLNSQGSRRAQGAIAGRSPISRSRRLRPLLMRRADFTSIFMRAMSTPVGQSRLQPLQLTHRSIACGHRIGGQSPPCRAGPTARAAGCWRGRASDASRRASRGSSGTSCRHRTSGNGRCCCTSRRPWRSRRSDRRRCPARSASSVRGSFWTFHADQSSAGL